MEPHPFNNIKAEKIWGKDKKRLDILKSLGYIIKVIWEFDYMKNNKENIINECLNFIRR